MHNTEKSGLGVVSYWSTEEVCLHSLLSPAFGDCWTKSLSTSCAGRVPFMGKIRVPLSEDKAGPACPSRTGCLFTYSNFNSNNPYTKVAHFGAACLEPHQNKARGHSLLGVLPKRWWEGVRAQGLGPWGFSLLIPTLPLPGSFPGRKAPLLRI